MGVSHVFSNLTAGQSSPRPLASPGIPWAQSDHPSGQVVQGASP